MYAIEPVKGDHLPPKTLCLTYDDGPGENTLPIATFLFEQGIQATFFVVGKYAVQRQHILVRLAEMGHLIGNHTYDHPDLPYYVSINGDLQSQILRTDAIIKPYTDRPIFFRAPYGKWSEEVANELNIHFQCAINHVGPIHWDVGGIDCYYWQTGKSLATAVSDYKKAIDEAGKGIVVMHDDISDMDVVKPLNQTLELTKQLIPILQSEGYCFVRLDEVVALQNPTTNFEVYLKTVNGKSVHLYDDKNIALAVGSFSEKTVFNVEETEDGKIMLRRADGRYLCLVHDDALQLSAVLSPEARFDLIPVFDDRFILRAYNGHFINTEANTGKLTATAPYMRLATVFRYQPVEKSISKPISLRMQLRLWKKRFAFIKSKLLSR